MVREVLRRQTQYFKDKVSFLYHRLNNQITLVYGGGSTLIELIWTITPALILIAIAFPSFRLLYLLDLPKNE